MFCCCHYGVKPHGLRPQPGPSWGRPTFHGVPSTIVEDPFDGVRTPWNTSEDDHEIRMWFDMPGLAAENIDVNVVDDLLVIKGDGGVDAFGNKIYSPYDSRVQLPLNSWKEEITAVFKNGVLYITVPKITKFEHKIIHVPLGTSWVGLGSPSVVSPTPSLKTPSSRSSLVVRAQQAGGSPKRTDPMAPEHFHKKVALLETSPYGLGAENIKVEVVDNMLVIRGDGGIDAFGNKVFSPRETTLHLPFNSWKEEITAVFKNGVLYITVPKILKFEHKIIHIPVRSI
uniref:SHSP domain-containing protein n=1 Tax=Chenopodium quinoa TaxID=63459 RepID=A0A803KNB2_CHEQI